MPFSAEENRILTSTDAATPMGELLRRFWIPALVADAWESFKQELGGIEYRPLIPADQDPPADLNRDMMETFRPAMREHYLNKKPTFV